MIELFVNSESAPRYIAAGELGMPGKQPVGPQSVQQTRAAAVAATRTLQRRTQKDQGIHAPILQGSRPD